MRLGWRDGLATVLVVLVAVPYVAFLASNPLGFADGPRMLAAIGLVLGGGAFLVARRAGAAAHDRVTTAESVLAGATGAVGVVALAMAGAAAGETLLAIFMIAIALVWAVEMLHHAGMLPTAGMRAVHH